MAGKQSVGWILAWCILMVVPGLVPSSAMAGDRVTNSLGMEFVWIEPGEYMRGSTEGEAGRYTNERQHRVVLTEGFYLQATEVTQGQWTAVMGNNPSHFKDCGDSCPVEQVSWDDVQEFIDRLNRKDSRLRYRLPSEAEWEYAARAGSTTRFHFGDDEAKLGDYAWFSGNSGSCTHPVGIKKPNAWNLYDMHGNVWEWVSDWYGRYPWDAVTNPTGPSSGSTSRVRRGGSWHGGSRGCRSANRNFSSPAWKNRILGFRLAAVQP